MRCQLAHPQIGGFRAGGGSSPGPICGPDSKEVPSLVYTRAVLGFPISGILCGMVPWQGGVQVPLLQLHSSDHLVISDP